MTRIILQAMCCKWKHGIEGFLSLPLPLPEQRHSPVCPPADQHNHKELILHYITEKSGKNHVTIGHIF